MARVSNARSSHVERWVVPAAREILIQEACKDAPTKFLDEVAFLEMGQSPAGESVNEDGDGTPFIGGPSDLGIEFPNTNRFTTTPNKLSQQNDIIVCVRATIGEPRWSNGVYALGRGVAGIRPKNSDIDRKFLFRIVQANERLLYEQGTGTTFKTITKDHLAKIIVPILPPKTQKAIGDFLAWLESHVLESPDFSTAPELPEFLQSRIVTIKKVEALTARISKAQFLREEISTEIDLLLAAELKKLRYELLESTFAKNKLGNIAQVTAGGTPSRDNPSYWKGKIPWIRTGELLDGDIYSSGEHITEEGMKNSSAKLFPKETVLIALYGQGQTRGRTGRLMIEATTNQACCAILPTPDLLEPRFTQYWLRSLYYEMREQNHGGAQPNWNGAMIKNIEISIPPLDEQRRIVAYLDSVQARLASLRELQSATGEELSALLPSVLDRAFKGEL